MAIPTTVTIEGKKRPTRNSEGRLIHSTLQGIRNFWRWFGDSKVVDGKGRPLIVYHGTTAPSFAAFEYGTLWGEDEYGDPVLLAEPSDTNAAMGVNFATEPSVARKFALAEGESWLRYRGSKAGGHIYPVYLCVSNPMFFLRTEEDISNNALVYGYSAALDEWAEIYEEEYPKNFQQLTEIIGRLTDRDVREDGSTWHAEVYQELGESYQAYLRQMGYDGVYYKNDIEGGYAWITFHPTQIKSAVANKGTFSNTDPTITNPRRRKR